MTRNLLRVSTRILAALLVTCSLASCDDKKSVQSAPPSAVPSPSVEASPTPPTDRDGDGVPDAIDPYPDDPKNTPQQAPVTLLCDLGYDSLQSMPYHVVAGSDGLPDFADVWFVKPRSCEAETPVFPVTAKEEAAYKISKYDSGQISTLYEICAAVDSDDVFTEPGFTASIEQIPEMSAALTLCPTHPHAKKWREAIGRGKADAELAAQGRLFGSGIFRVGKEIRPGTYFTTNVEGCYWERQDSSGNIIDNYFTNSARRVQVTIRSSDYAFSSERCGEWRPAR